MIFPKQEFHFIQDNLIVPQKNRKRAKCYRVLRLYTLIRLQLERDQKVSAAKAQILLSFFPLIMMQ